jgi:DNA modification methylase
LTKIPKIETVEISKLKPWGKNPRKNHAVDAIAKSIETFGYLSPIIVQAGTYRILAGHGRLAAFKKQGAKEIPVVVAELSDRDADLYTIADNKLTERADWDGKLLAELLTTFKAEGLDLALTGFEGFEIDKLLPPTASDEQPLPEPPANPTSSPGDIWECGSHRLLCGDSTDAAQISALMAGQTAAMVHADPPYGMGKEADGVQNDNIYGPKLDEFQMRWWCAVRPHVQSNGSAYIWGAAPDLWRLWWTRLSSYESLTLRNEIVWDKKNIAGMKSPELTQYPEASERCLFFQLGHHVFLVGQTKEDYWDGWEPIRAYLDSERTAAGLSPSKTRQIVGNHMHNHWFSKSQWVMISEENYQKLAKATGRFARSYSELHAEYQTVLAVFRGEVRDPRFKEFAAGRPYFDNAHESMTDVWEFARVVGEERHEHATPKPVPMMERAIRSSARRGEIVVEPFCGSGSTMIAAETTGRRCFSIEISPAYVDVSVLRWQNLTKNKARNLTRPEVVL